MAETRHHVGTATWMGRIGSTPVRGGLRAEGRCPTRRSRLMPIIACTAGCQSPLPLPAVPGCHAGLHPGERQGFGPCDGQGWLACHRPCQGTGGLRAAEEQAGHQHAASERRRVQRPGSLHEVSPFLTSGMVSDTLTVACGDAYLTLRGVYSLCKAQMMRGKLLTDA
jgi:hypothetical protein